MAKKKNSGANNAASGRAQSAVNTQKGGTYAATNANGGAEDALNGAQPENVAQENTAQAAEMKSTRTRLAPKYRVQQFFYELADLLKGAVFPFIVMCVFSTTIILFYGFEDMAVRILAVVLGEALIIGSFVMFGRQNGAAAYRRFKINEGKRKLGKRDKKVVFKTGEYAPLKGFVIGFISAVPFLILQIIKCFGDFEFVNFLLEYACGWAVAPLEVISSAIPQPYYLLMVLLPVAVQGGFYIQGMFAEKKRQEQINRVEDDKRKGKKKHYYEENVYEPDREVDISGADRGKKRK